MQVCLPKGWVRVCVRKAPRRAQFEKNDTIFFRAFENNFFPAFKDLAINKLEPHFCYL
jgi:hypothetical protein